MKFLFSIIFIFNALFLFAQDINISNPKQLYIGEYMKVYNDKNFNNSLEYIQKNTHLFTPLKQDIDSRFFTQDTIWYHLKVSNTQLEKLERYFVLDIPWFDYIEIFVIDSNQLYHYEGGNLFELSKRSYKTNLVNIKHNFEQGISDIFIKSKTSDPFVFPLSILDYQNLLELSLKKHTISFSIYSIILSMMLFNFILYFIIKHISYLYYSLFLFSFLCMNMTYNNYSFEYLIGNYPLLQNWLEGAFIYIFSILGLLFTQSFLEFKQNYPKLYTFTWILIICFFLLGFITFILMPYYFVAISILTAIIFGLYSLCVAVYCVKKKNRSAIFFVLGVSFGLIGTIITALSVSAILPTFNIHMYKAVDYGIVIDTILLSIALAKRYTILFENLQKTQQELVQLSINLENMVRDRTDILNRELQNNQLLLKEVFHRVKNNLQIISSLLILQTKNIQDPLLIKSILEENIQRIQSISTLHEKIFHSKNLNEIPLKPFIKEILFDFIDLTGFNTLKFKLNIQNRLISINHIIPFGLIINELLTNSFKYAFNTQENTPEIVISLYTENEKLIFRYQDNGDGANLEEFTQGFGFSLLESLCIHQLGGNPSFYNEKGFNYKIEFPNEALTQKN